MREFFLMLIAFVLVGVLALPVLAIGSIARRDKKRYWMSVAVGLDQVGGSLLYGTEDWTVSSWTYYECSNRGKYCFFMKFIDWIFGDGHCKRSYEKESKEGRYEQLCNFS